MKNFSKSDFMILYQLLLTNNFSVNISSRDIAMKKSGLEIKINLAKICLDYLKKIFLNRLEFEKLGKLKYSFGTYLQRK